MKQTNTPQEPFCTEHGYFEPETGQECPICDKTMTYPHKAKCLFCGKTYDEREESHAEKCNGGNTK